MEIVTEERAGGHCVRGSQGDCDQGYCGENDRVDLGLDVVAEEITYVVTKKEILVENLIEIMSKTSTRLVVEEVVEIEKKKMTEIVAEEHHGNDGRGDCTESGGWILAL